jgi:hypothetical protein
MLRSLPPEYDTIMTGKNLLKYSDSHGMIAEFLPAARIQRRA